MSNDYKKTSYVDPFGRSSIKKLIKKKTRS